MSVTFPYPLGGSIYQGATTSNLPIAYCCACGGIAHKAGIGACPEVEEVEYDSYGAVKRFRKRGA